MGLLDDLLDGLAGQAQSGQLRERSTPPAPTRQAGGGMGEVMTALLPVVLAMLSNRGAGGGPANLGPRGGSGGGGGLADLIGAVLGGSRSAAGPGGAGGGLGDLLSQLQRAGFGAQADSWVGRGQNLPIPPEGMEQVLGRDGVAQIARHLGVSEADATRGLSQLLPEVVDRVTPDGRVPDLDSLAASVDALTRRTRRA